MPKFEWRTVALAATIYLGWAAVTLMHKSLPFPLLALSGGMLIAWHGSLQHETIHGHPTGNARLNAFIGGIPLSFWIPYRIYARTHREHHRSSDVTHPHHDPESRYVAGGRGTWLARWRATLFGQLLVGPIASIAGFLAAEVRRAVTTPREVARDWVPHLIGVGGLIVWLEAVGFALSTYILAFVVPGQALTLLRGFAEHRADAPGPARAATVTSRGPLALLFLNNNLHAAHHANPAAPWYALPAIERARTAFGEPRYDGYRDVVRRFALRPHDVVIHPRAGGRAT